MAKTRYMHRLKTVFKRTTPGMHSTNLIATIQIAKLINFLAVRILVQTSQTLITTMAPLIRNNRRATPSMRSTMSAFDSEPLAFVLHRTAVAQELSTALLTCQGALGRWWAYVRTYLSRGIS